jgi:hypothetical protein
MGKGEKPKLQNAIIQYFQAITELLYVVDFLAIHPQTRPIIQNIKKGYYTGPWTLEKGWWCLM